MRQGLLIRPGLYAVHKPAGPSSFSLVREWGAQRADPKLKLCHGGTLDPFAEGLLLLLAGSATRLFEWLHAAPKTYVALVAWGAETDNGDPTGRVVSSGDATLLTPASLDGALQPFLGWTEQVPPETSAKKVDGEPAYRKVHRGERVTLPPSRVYLHSARWLEHELPRASRLELVCRGGFYVRSLARDLGRALGCGAHVRALSRTRIGPWEDPTGEPVWHRGRAMLPWAPARELTREELLALRRGEALPAGELSPPHWPFPDGFPDAGGPVLGLRGDGVIALLASTPAGLALRARFPNAV